MKILSFSLDNKILDKNSSVAKRAIEYGELVDEYIIIFPTMANQYFNLSEKVKVYSSGGRNKFFQLCKVFYLANKILRLNKFSLITTQTPYFLAFTGLLLAKKFNIGLEIQIHGWEKYKGIRKVIAKFNLPRANAVRVVSQRLEKQLISEFRVKKEKITVVPIFVDTTSSSRVSTSRQSNFTFLTVGRLVPIKNISMQIKAIAEVIKKYPNTELWIAGDGSEKEKLELDIRNLKLENNIKLLGWQENLNNYYSQADVFVLSSNYEGWGMVVIEAAVNGLPIIMTNVGCAEEVIINNESGLIIPVGDSQSLKNSMIKLMEDNELRKKLGDQAKLAIQKLPDKQQTLELYIKSWQKAIL